LTEHTNVRDRQTLRDGLPPAALCIASRGKHLYNAVWRVEHGPQFRCTVHTSCKCIGWL